MRNHREPLLTLLVALALGAATTPTAADELPRLPEPDRIVAIGDLHGDLEATRRALRLAGAIDGTDRWIGGDLVVVQTGDQLDRGDGEREILDLLVRLRDEAARAGGALHVLNGNHELMNARPDLRYVTEGGFAAFADCADTTAVDSLLLSFPPEQRGRVAAFRPGGPYARILADRPLFLLIGENAFVHGGILPEHVDYGLVRLDAEVRTWLRGEGPCPAVVHTGESPTWTRLFSDEVNESDCEILAAVLSRLGARRLIMGHTVMEAGITALCDSLAMGIDVGLGAAYGGPLEVLEIQGGRLRVLRGE